LTALLVARLSLALVFVVAAVGKLADHAAFRRSLSGFRVPATLVGPAAVALPLAELAVAGLLVPQQTASAAAWAALGLLVVFSIAIARALARDERPDCGCLGRAHSAPVSGGLLVRNGVLAALAGAVAIAGPGETVAAIELSARVVFDAAIVAAVGGLGWFSWHLFNQNGRLIERVRALEAAAEPDLQSGPPRPLMSVEQVAGHRDGSTELAGSRAAEV
jgi:hypothetical protein